MADKLPFDPDAVAQAAHTRAVAKPIDHIDPTPLPAHRKANGHDVEAITGEIVPPEFADDALGLRFSTLFVNSLRYVSAWGKWMTWDGTLWRKDDTLHVYDLVRRVCRSASGEAPDKKLSVILASGKTVASVEKLVRADRRHAATAQQWDADPWLLNTPSGVIDLRNGDLRLHDPNYHMTKTAAVTPGVDCPTWLNFLDVVTAGNVGLQAYLQRVAGYSLTGSIREQAMFFAYGTGGNGKGTFLNTIQAIMGDYALVSNADTFTATSGARHLTELARLQGARLVVAQETEDGKYLAEARVKAITGGDPITANFMRQDHFTFIPQFKLFISGNHKPALRNVDAAIRRRFNMVPFDVEIPKAAQDHDLPDKLRSEWPGILQWMIDGCLDWQHVGLTPPQAVQDATGDYFEAQDAMGAWISECCNTGNHRWEPASILFKSWRSWALASGHEPGSQIKLGDALDGRGFRRKREAGTGRRGFDCIALKVAASWSEPEGDRA